MLRCVALVRTVVLEEPSASIIKVTRISELGTMLAITSNRRMLQRNTNLVLVLDLVFLRRMHRLLDMANVAPSSQILVALMMEALCSSETSVLTRAT
jgi:hypothetical protein